MAEFIKAALGNSYGKWSLVVLTILMACMFFGLRKFSTVTRQPLSLGAGADRTYVSKEASVANPKSMNIFEHKLFLALASIQSHLVAKRAGSWGWTIVLLTIGINLLLLPLRIASMKSGVKMQRLQPAIKKIRDRYKNVSLTDPRHNEMSAEIAQLQRDSGVNIWGGCVPLLLQMPLLLAFFGMLRKAPVLNGAGWLWLHDLSSADPHHVLPMLMSLSQLLVQLSTPSPGSDGRQKTIVACLTTVAFGYVGWHYASGLALYALTESVVSLLTQAVMNRSPLGREMRALGTQ